MNEQKAWWWVSDESILELSGSDAMDLLQRISSQDVIKKLQETNATSTLFCDEKGKLRHWCMVLQNPNEVSNDSAHRLGITVKTDQAQALKEWIEKYIIIEDARVDLIVNVSVVRTINPPAALPTGPWSCFSGRWTGQSQDIWVGSENLNTLADALDEQGIERANPERVERFRIDWGVPDTAELETTAAPFQLRLDASVGWNKGCYIGQEVLSRLDSYDKVARRLMGLSLVSSAEQSALIQTGDRVLSAGKTIGKITSVSNTKQTAIALLEKDHLKPGHEVQVNTSEWRLEDRKFWL